MDASYQAHLTASYYGKINCVSFTSLIEELGSAENLLKTPKSTLLKHLTENNATNFISYAKSFSPNKIVDDLKKNNITYVPKYDSLFPLLLKDLPDSPIGLFVKGNVKLLSEKRLFIVIIGSRLPSSYGKTVTQLIISGLPSDQVCIVSGLALGIDGEAHRQALSSKIPTIAVMGCGVDVVYPASHKGLYEAIIKNNGTIVSEIPPGVTPEKYYFVARNRIVAGISHAVVVIEGSNNSGTLITARLAAEYDRPVFAVPHPITSRGGNAPHQLIKDGAQIITTSTDLINYFNLTLSQKKSPHQLSPMQNSLLKLITDNPDFDIDHLFGQSKTPAQDFFATLSELELKGVVAKAPNGTYYRVK